MAKRVAKKTAAVREIALPEPVAIDIPAPVPMSAVLGQDRAVSVLQRALKAGKLHHAWLVGGPQGVGKFTLALSFASVILDPTSAVGLDGQVAPEEGSQTQQLLAAGTHPDLHVIVKELARFHPDADVRNRKLTNIPTLVIEEFLIGQAERSAVTTRHGMAGKVFIIDEAELLDAAAQNRLLKTLEEPPPGTVLILVTSQEERLLPTIRSRCQRVTLGPLDHESMMKWARLELADVASGERDWLIEFAEGAPGVAAAAREAGLFEWHKTLSPLLAEAVKGKHAMEFAAAGAELIEKYAASWVEEHPNASKESANRAGARWLLRILGGRLRSGLAAGGRPTEVYLESIDLTHSLEMQLLHSVQPQFALDLYMSELAARFAAMQVSGR